MPEEEYLPYFKTFTAGDFDPVSWARAAKAAGIYTIAVNTGPLSDQVLTDAGADIVLRDMHGLKEWLQQKSQTTNNDIHQSLPLSMRQPATWLDRGEDMLV